MAEIKFLKGSLTNWASKTDINENYFYVVNDTASDSLSLYLGNKLLANGADVNDLANEIAARIAADQVLTKSIEDLEDSMNTKISEAIAGVIDSAPEDFDTLKEIADYIASDKTKAAEMSNAIAANASAIEAEVTRAKATEETLQSNLDAEVTRASGVESNLSTAIDTEKARAEAAESGLSDAIAAEKTRAEGAEGELSDAIVAEKDRAEGAESNLQSQIDALSEASHTHDNKDVLDGISSEKVVGWDSSLSEAKSYTDVAKDELSEIINGVITSYGEADSAIYERINEVVLDLSAEDVKTANRVEEVYSELSNSISSEKSRATAAEADLQAQITANILTAKEDSNVVIEENQIGLQWGTF